MADDSVSYDVIVDFITRNAASSQAEIDKFQASLDTLNDQGRTTERQFEAATRALLRMGKGLETGLGNVKRYTKDFSELDSEVRRLEKNFQALQQAAVLNGSSTPGRDALSQLGLSPANIQQVETALRVSQQASHSLTDELGLTGEKLAANKRVADVAAKDWIANEERKEAASKRVADAVARDWLAAEQRRQDAQLQGARDRNQFDVQKADTRRQEELRSLRQDILARADAEREAEKAQREALKATQDQEAALPRLRYALHDVSTSLTVAGAAMIGLAGATVGASVVMDRQFADVIRTTEAYMDDTGRTAERLRDQFNDLFSTLPASWADLTDIGALAGQLNIASDNVAEFTKLVAQFAATTDVSIEDSATAFGRLSELLDVPASQFQNLGSSILAVGVNSVATESQIINISTQITSMAASAGFSADQVFGLSSALASLGTQPELSRGVITRLFTNINNAIQQGGDRLERFGALVGQTGQEFAQGWGEDASGSLLALMRGIGSQEGPAAVSTLQELGIVAARDVPTLLRLAQNSDVLADSLAVAAQGYADGTALSDQYGVVALTVAERLKVLWNNVQLLFTAFGDTQSVLGPVIDQLTEVVRAFTAIASNPVGQWLSLVAIGAIALGGALALVAGAATRGVAGFIALRTALVEMNAISATAPLTLKGMIAGLVGTSAASSSTAANLRALSLSMIGLEAGATRAAVATRVLNVALKASVVGAAITGGFYLLTKAVNAIGDAMRSNQQIAKDYLGDLTGFQEAVSADSASDYAGKVFGRISKEAPKASKATDDARVATETWLGIQREVPEGVDDATNALSDQNLVLGENAEAWLKNTLAQNEAFREFAADDSIRAAAEAIGFDMQEFIAQGLAGEGALDTAVAELNAKITDALEDGRTESFGGLFASADEASAGLGELYAQVNDNLAPTFKGLYDTLNENVAVNELLGSSATGAADGYDDLAGSAIDSLESFFEIQNQILGVQNSLFDLGEALAENGADFDFFSQNGRDNTEALLGAIQAITEESGSEIGLAVSNLQILFDYLVAGGYASAEQLSVLSGAIAELKGQLGTTTDLPDATLEINSFFGGWASGAEKARKETKKAKEEIITISDYARDLASIWNRAFDIRFGGQETMDGITTAFQALRDEAAQSAERVQGFKDDVKDLKDEILSLNSDIKGLQADKALQEYFLGVANQYGDSQRAQQIRERIRELDEEIREKQGEVADKNSEIAEANAEAAKETESQSKALTGNSAEAVKNRAAIRDLVAQYQSHIEALANSGLSEEQLRVQTEQLRNDFLAQATQLGYNREELGLYAAAFDDVRVAIDNVPRNINVTADVDPAIQALNEFEAKARAVAEGASEAIATGNGLGYNVPEIILPVKAEIQDLTLSERIRQGMAYQVPNSPFVLEPFAGGGFTGRGGKYDAAGIVHKGEYVVRKELVNQRTGLPYADALGHLSRGVEGRTGYAGGGFVSGSGLSGTVVVGSFGPMAQQQLMTSQSTHVSLSSRSLADSSSREYSNSSAIGSA